MFVCLLLNHTETMERVYMKFDKHGLANRFYPDIKEDQNNIQRACLCAFHVCREYPRELVVPHCQSLNGNTTSNKMSEGYLWKSKADSESETSESEPFLVKGAFLITPAAGLTAERATALTDKMEFRGGFSVTRTATGVLFKFSDYEDYQMVFRKGFHKLTGSRFYRKVAIPCRPRRTFTICVYEVPDEVPEEDLRLALRRYTSLVELCRLQQTGTNSPKPSVSPVGSESGQVVASTGSRGCSVVRVILSSSSEAECLLARGLDFFGATSFPTDMATPAQTRLLSRPTLSRVQSTRVRELLPVFDMQSNKQNTSRLLNAKK